MAQPVCLPHLWLPILLSAVAAFAMSSLVHMVFKWHNADYGALPDEAGTRSALRGIAPGQYTLPHCGDMKNMENPEVQARFKEGPVGLLWIMAPGLPAMGRTLGIWFVYMVAVSLLVAGIGVLALPAGAPCGTVSLTTGLAALLAYAGGRAQDSIWMGKPWRATLKDLLDGFLYALATGLVFGWLWPR